MVLGVLFVKGVPFIWRTFYQLIQEPSFPRHSFFHVFYHEDELLHFICKENNRIRAVTAPCGGHITPKQTDTKVLLLFDRVV